MIKEGVSAVVRRMVSRPVQIWNASGTGPIKMFSPLQAAMYSSGNALMRSRWLFCHHGYFACQFAWVCMHVKGRVVPSDRNHLPMVWFVSTEERRRVFVPLSGCFVTLRLPKVREKEKSRKTTHTNKRRCVCVWHWGLVCAWSRNVNDSPFFVM